MSVDRATRVANGSRRKRDLAAVGIERRAVPEVEATREEREAWVARHLPGENHYCVTSARIRLHAAGRPVNAETVREWLRGRGWLKEQNS